MFIYKMRKPTLCHRCRCVITPTDNYVSRNVLGFIIFMHADGVL